MMTAHETLGKRFNDLKTAYYFEDDLSFEKGSYQSFDVFQSVGVPLLSSYIRELNKLILDCLDIGDFTTARRASLLVDRISSKISRAYERDEA